jgi:hypothetical protein
VWPLGQPLSAQILALRITEQEMFGHLAFFETCFLHLVFSTLRDMHIEKYLHGGTSEFEARMDPLEDQDLCI